MSSRKMIKNVQKYFFWNGLKCCVFSEQRKKGFIQFFSIERSKETFFSIPERTFVYFVQF